MMMKVNDEFQNENISNLKTDLKTCELYSVNRVSIYVFLTQFKSKKKKDKTKCFENVENNT